MRLVFRIVGQALALSAFACVIAAVVNATRASGLPWVARAPYEIYNESVTREPEAVRVSRLPSRMDRLIIIDARRAAAFERGHLPGARSLPFDPSVAPPAELLAEAKAAGPNRVLVYGRARDELGLMLAFRFAEAGCFGVRYLRGGFAAWVAAGRPTEKGGGS